MTALSKELLLTTSQYQSIHKGAKAIEAQLGMDTALKTIELTARLTRKPLVTRETRQAAEQALEIKNSSDTMGDAMVIIFNNEPRYPIQWDEKEETRREKRKVIERIRDFRGLSTQELAESVVDDLANAYLAIENSPIPEDITKRAFIAEALTGPFIPGTLRGLSQAIGLCRETFSSLAEEMTE